MSLAASRIAVTRALTARAPVQQQKRGIVDYLTKYPDKVRACGLVRATKGIVKYPFGFGMGPGYYSNQRSRSVFLEIFYSITESVHSSMFCVPCWNNRSMK